MNEGYAFHARDAHLARMRAQQSQNYEQVGKVLIPAQSKSDETVVTVTFAFPFVREPVFTFGSALDNNEPWVAGSFPTCSATVLKWATVLSGLQVGWVGATLGIVTTGLSIQNLWVHWTFKERALSFPAGAQASNGPGNVQ